MAEEKIWGQDFTLAIASNFCLALILYALMTSIAIYAMQRFHTSESIAGLASSIFIIGALIFRIVAVKLSDRIGRKKIMIIGLVLHLAVMLLYLTVSNIGLLLAVRFIHGCVYSTVTTLLTLMAMAALPPSKLGEGNGYFSMSIAVATAIGPFLAVYVLGHFSYDILFFSGAILSLIALVLVLPVKIAEDEPSPEPTALEKETIGVINFLEKSILPICLLILMSGIAYSSITAFISPYSFDIGIPAVASNFFLIFAIFLFIFRPIAGKLLDRKGENLVIYPAYVSFAISLLLIAWGRNFLCFLLAGILLAFGYGVIMPSMQTIALRTAPQHRMGTALATYFFFLDFGNGVGPYLLGLMVQMTGFSQMYLALGIFVVILIPVYYLVHGRKAVRHS